MNKKMLERIILGGIISLLLLAIGYLKTIQWKLENDLKSCMTNQEKVLGFCNENQRTRDKVREALEKNKEGVDGFNSVLDTLFEKKK